MTGIAITGLVVSILGVRLWDSPRRVIRFMWIAVQPAKTPLFRRGVVLKNLVFMFNVRAFVLKAGM